MGSFTIKGTTIGAGSPKTIVSLMGETQEKLLAQAKAAVANGAECVEWRADYLAAPLDLEAMARTARSLDATLPHTPLIFTFRSVTQGGQRTLSKPDYVALCKAAIASGGVDLIDVELCIGDRLVSSLVDHAHERGMRAIVSHHDFVGTPDTTWMAGELARMAALGADIPKLAVMATRATDCLRLMEATAIAHEQLNKPLLTMAMGPYGTLSRLAGEAFGSSLTFCALGKPSAPGQVALDQATELISRLHAVVANTEEGSS